MTKRPILLDRNMKPAKTLNPTGEALNLKLEPLSTARMTLCNGDSIAIGDCVELFSPNGSVGVFAAKNVETDNTTGDCEVSLEHSLCLLARSVIVGEHKTGEIAGSETAAKVDIETAMRFILDKQDTKFWELGECTVDFDGEWEFKDIDLLSALIGLTDDLKDYRWEFDQSVFPWKVSLLDTKNDTLPACEMRLTRNIESMTTTLDSTGMYTKLYIRGKDGVTIPAVERNVDVYGLICASYENPNITDAEKLTERANELLDAHAHPSVSVTIDGLDLSEATGEPMDRIQLGRVCRVPLPDYGTTINERITMITWHDVYNSPEQITVSMANQQATFTGAMKYSDQFVTEIMKHSGKDNQGIHSTVTGLGQVIRMADRLGMTVAEIVPELSTTVDQNEDHIQLIARAITSYGTWDEVEQALLEIKHDGILLEVAKGNIAAAINISPELIKISAERIDLDGIIEKIFAENEVDIGGNLFVEGFSNLGNTSAMDFSCNSLTVDGTSFSSASIENWKRTTAGGLVHKTIQYVGADGNIESVNVVTDVTFPSWTSSTITALVAGSGE